MKYGNQNWKPNNYFIEKKRTKNRVKDRPSMTDSPSKES